MAWQLCPGGNASLCHGNRRSLISAADPDGQTVTRPPRKPDTENNTIGGCPGGSISGGYGAIEQQPENERTPVFAEKTGVCIVQDSSGNYYLMGDEGREPHSGNIVKRRVKWNPSNRVAQSVAHLMTS